MRKVELTGGRALTQVDLNRSGALPREVMDAAEGIVRDVRDRGDAAVREYCTRFDGACPESFRVPDELVKAAPSMVDPEFLESLTRARDQILAFHQKEREESWFTTRPDGTLLGVQVTPVASAAVYVPGGRAQYPSTVLMDTIPAKVAGVPRVVMVTPPQRDGSLSAYTLAAAALAGVDEVYAVGGAQAIGAVAYGTESIRVRQDRRPRQRLCGGRQALRLGRRGHRHGGRPLRGVSCWPTPPPTPWWWPPTSWPRPSTILFGQLLPRRPATPSCPRASSRPSSAW